MITDAQTNLVYFSDILQKKENYNPFCKELISVLTSHSIDHKFLPETNDIWCRDFMPIQVDHDKFIEYRYDPDYLQDKQGRRIKSYPDIVCDKIGLNTTKSEVILDGGNVIKWMDKVILTDKIIPENSSKYLKSKLIDQLVYLFEVDEIILIPWLQGEPFGHADGIVRFIDGDHVLIDGYFKQTKSDYSDKLYNILKKHKLNPVELNFSVPTQSNKNWGYINYLQMNDLLLIPQFGIDEDDQALEQIGKVFPEYKAKDQIVTIDASAIIKHGGVLNCISWNIKI